MADVHLKGLPDHLLARIDAYRRQRGCTREEWFESAAEHELEDISSNAPMNSWSKNASRPRSSSAGQLAGRAIVDRRKYVNIGEINLLSKWKIVVHRLIELPENFAQGGWGWTLFGIVLTFLALFGLQIITF